MSVGVDEMGSCNNAIVMLPALDHIIIINTKLIMKKYTTGHEKRKLQYTGPGLSDSKLELP